MTCNYIAPDGKIKCTKLDVKYNKCIFHLSAMHKEEKHTSLFNNELNKLINANDTNWAGFVFPEKFKLYDLSFDEIVDLRWSDFEDIVINNVTFNENFDMQHSIVKGDCHLSNIEFNKAAIFFDSEFHKNAEFNVKFNGLAGFNDCDFHGRVSFLGSFSGKGTFHMSRFHQAVTFRGGRDVSMIGTVRAGSVTVTGDMSYHDDNLPRSIFSKVKMFFVVLKNNIKSSAINLIDRIKKIVNTLYSKSKNLFFKYKRQYIPVNDSSVTIRWLFDSAIVMTEVDFRLPERVKFMGVDMSNVSLIGTDLKGVHFDDVKFYQSTLKRQGLYDEVLLLYSMDYNTRSYMWPRVESEYRNVRVSMENNKSFSAATDFYIGEMEARRQQMFYPKRFIFSIEAIYHTLSNYGSEPIRAIRLFLWLVLLHAVLTMSYAIEAKDAFLSVYGEEIQFPIIHETFNTFLIYIVNSFKIMTLQRGEAVLHMDLTSMPSHIIDTVFRVLGPTQIALIILAIRVKIKRH